MEGGRGAPVETLSLSTLGQIASHFPCSEVVMAAARRYAQHSVTGCPAALAGYKAGYGGGYPVTKYTRVVAPRESDCPVTNQPRAPHWAHCRRLGHSPGHGSRRGGGHVGGGVT